MAKLEEIVIPAINFQDTSIEEAIDFLRMRSFELEAGEPERRGVSWIMKSRRSDAADSSAGGLDPVEPNQVQKINYSAKNVGLLTAMEEIARQAHLDVYLTNVGIVICGPGESPLPVGKMDGEEVWKTIHKEALPHSTPESATRAEAAKRHFAQYDQITAFATAKPVSGKVRYELRIKNVGSEPLVGLGETSQQWQSLEDDPKDLNEWNEHIPISTDGVGVFELGPDEEFICEVEPRFRNGARIRFGFLVFTQVGDDAHRRMRIWTEPRTPESDFATILQPESADKTPRHNKARLDNPLPRPESEVDPQ